MTAYGYDDEAGAGGRLAQTKYYASVTAYNNGSGTPDEGVDNAYDGFGRITQTTNGTTSTSVTLSYLYDAEGRQIQVQTVTGSRTDQVNYEYNALGELVRTYTGDPVAAGSSADSDGKAVTDARYAYDALGRLIQVTLVERNDTVLGMPEVTGYYFDAAGNLKDTVGSNGLTADYTYDDLNRLTSLVDFADSDQDRTVDSGETIAAKFVYTLNADGSKAGETDFGDASTNVTMSYAWTYDGLGRLVTETYVNTVDSSLVR